MKVIDADEAQKKLRKRVAKAYETGNGEWEGLIVARSIIDAQPAVQIPDRQWVPIGVRTPDKSGSYIVTTITGAVCITHYFAEGGFFSRHLNNRIIAWMDKPEPYKEDTHGTDK